MGGASSLARIVREAPLRILGKKWKKRFKLKPLQQ